MHTRVLVAVKVREVDGSFVVWTLIFGGLGVGVLRGTRRNAWWLVIVQGFCAARIAISTLIGNAVPLYFLMLFTGALVVSTVGSGETLPSSPAAPPPGRAAPPRRAVHPPGR